MATEKVKSLNLKSNLLTPELESLRLGSKICLYSVKGDPRKPEGDVPGYQENLQKYGELESVQRSMLIPPEIHAICNVPGRLALIRKKIPHGMYEMTVMAQDGYGANSNSSIFDFTKEIRESFYNIGVKFAEFSENKQFYPVISYTFDPFTQDRKAAQSVKTFHLQLTARTPDELNEMRAQVFELGIKTSAIERRQLIDESTIVLSRVMYDYFISHPIPDFEPISPLTIDSCPNIRFIIGKGWEVLSNEEFDTNLQLIHNLYVSFFEQFFQTTSNGKLGQWERPLPEKTNIETFVEGLTWLTDKTRLEFTFFLNNLRFKYLGNTEALKKNGIINHVFPLSGACYGVTLTKADNGNLMLSFRPQIFLDTGGTGLQYLDPVGANVKVVRGNGLYSEKEIKEKVLFESECTGYITTNKGGGKVEGVDGLLQI